MRSFEKKRAFLRETPMIGMLEKCWGVGVLGGVGVVGVGVVGVGVGVLGGVGMLVLKR